MQAVELLEGTADLLCDEGWALSESSRMFLADEPGSVTNVLSHDLEGSGAHTALL